MPRHRSGEPRPPVPDAAPTSPRSWPPPSPRSGRSCSPASCATSRSAAASSTASRPVELEKYIAAHVRRGRRQAETRATRPTHARLTGSAACARAASARERHAPRAYPGRRLAPTATSTKSRADPAQQAAAHRRAVHAVQQHLAPVLRHPAQRRAQPQPGGDRAGGGGDRPRRPAPAASRRRPATTSHSWRRGVEQAPAVPGPAQHAVEGADPGTSSRSRAPTDACSRAASSTRAYSARLCSATSRVPLGQREPLGLLLEVVEEVEEPFFPPHARTLTGPGRGMSIAWGQTVDDLIDVRLEISNDIKREDLTHDRLLGLAVAWPRLRWRLPGRGRRRLALARGPLLAVAGPLRRGRPGRAGGRSPLRRVLAGWLRGRAARLRRLAARPPRALLAARPPRPALARPAARPGRPRAAAGRPSAALPAARSPACSASRSGAAVAGPRGRRRHRDRGSRPARRTHRARPPGPALAAARPRPVRADVVVVRPGDSLWSIAAGCCRPAPTDAVVTAAWHRLHRANLARVGPDPDLIHPGTRLVVPTSDPRAAPPERNTRRSPHRTPRPSRPDARRRRAGDAGDRHPARPAGRRAGGGAASPTVQGTLALDLRPARAAPAAPELRLVDRRRLPRAPRGAGLGGPVRPGRRRGARRRPAARASCCAGRPPRVYQDLDRRVADPGPDRARAAAPARTVRPQVRSVHVFQPEPGTRRGQRARPARPALPRARRPARAPRERWPCTALQLGTEPAGDAAVDRASAVDAGGQAGRPAGRAVALLVLLAGAARALGVAARRRRTGRRRLAAAAPLTSASPSSDGAE